MGRKGRTVWRGGLDSFFPRGAAAASLDTVGHTPAAFRTNPRGRLSGLHGLHIGAAHPQIPSQKRRQQRMVFSIKDEQAAVIKLS